MKEPEKAQGAFAPCSDTGMGCNCLGLLREKRVHQQSDQNQAGDTDVKEGQSEGNINNHHSKKNGAQICTVCRWGEPCTSSTDS